MKLKKDTTIRKYLVPQMHPATKEKLQVAATVADSVIQFLLGTSAIS